MILRKLNKTTGIVVLALVLGAAALQSGAAQPPQDSAANSAGGLLQEAKQSIPSPATDAAQAGEAAQARELARSQLDQIERDKQREHLRLMKKEENKQIFAPTVAVMGLLSLLIVNYLLFTRGIASGAEIVNTTGLVLIIFGTLFVVVVADSDQQLTAAVGILGAVAGYLFGSSRGQPSAATRADQKKPPADKESKDPIVD